MYIMHTYRTIEVHYIIYENLPRHKRTMGSNNDFVNISLSSYIIFHVIYYNVSFMLLLYWNHIGCKSSNDQSNKVCDI